MMLATHSSGVDANLRRGVEQEQALPSIQTLSEIRIAKIMTT